MSQIDKINFLPHLFWFFVLFTVFYIIVFSYILPIIYQSLEVRSIFFGSLLNDCFSYYLFYQFFINFYNKLFFKNLIKLFFSYLKQYKNIQILFSAYTNKTFFTILNNNSIHEK